MELVGTSEIAHLLGVSRQRAHDIVAFPGFPKPAAVVGRHRLWQREDVEEWMRSSGRALPDEDED